MRSRFWLSPRQASPKTPDPAPWAPRTARRTLLTTASARISSRLACAVLLAIAPIEVRADLLSSLRLQFLPAHVSVGYGPTIPNGSYLNAQSVANTLCFTTVTIRADSSIDFVDDVDLASSPYGTPIYDFSLAAPTVSFSHNLNLSQYGYFGLNGYLGPVVKTVNLNGKITAIGNLIDPSRILNSTVTHVNVLDDTASIQQAMDLASPTSPVTVQVSAGQYHENLTINKSLTLRGDPGSSIGAGPNAPQLIGTQADSSIITVNANDVTIEGFLLTAQVPSGGHSANGVSAGGVDGLIIRHNTLAGFAGSGFLVPLSAVVDSNLILVTAVGDEPRAGRLAIRLAGPNPSSRSLSFEVTLADREPARLELCDVQGRRIASRDLSALGPGHHVVRLEGATGWRAGICFATVVQGAHRAGIKVVALR